MIFSIVYLAVRCLLGCLMVLTRPQMSKDAATPWCSRHENAVLRRQINRVRCQPGDRLWLAALSRLIPGADGARRSRRPQRHCSPGTGALSHVNGTTPAAGIPQTVHGSRDPKARDPHGNGEPNVGTPARARRTQQARPPDRGHDGLADPDAARIGLSIWARIDDQRQRSFVTGYPGRPPGFEDHEDIRARHACRTPSAGGLRRPAVGSVAANVSPSVIDSVGLAGAGFARIAGSARFR